MNVSKTQIQNLYTFTRQHFVEHYDLQTELVDHLANDIEAIWKDNPNLSFTEARDQSFKKFGVFGFMDVVEKKQKQMNRRYWKIIWRFTKEWFKLPKILITIAFIIGLFFLLKIKYSKLLILTVIFCLILLEIVVLYKNRKQKKKEKLFLLESMIGETRNGFIVINLVNFFNFINLTKIDFYTLNNFWILLTSIILVLLGILFYVINYVLPQKSKELLEETYPEYKMMESL